MFVHSPADARLKGFWGLGHEALGICCLAPDLLGGSDAAPEEEERCGRQAGGGQPCRRRPARGQATSHGAASGLGWSHRSLSRVTFVGDVTSLESRDYPSSLQFVLLLDTTALKSVICLMITHHCFQCGCKNLHA